MVSWRASIIYGFFFVLFTAIHAHIWLRKLAKYLVSTPDVLKSNVTAKLNETKIALNSHESFNKEDEKCNEETITTFLIARELNVPQTVETILKCQTWRVDFGVENINEETVKNEIERKGLF